MALGIHTLTICKGMGYIPDREQDILFSAIGDNWNDPEFEKRMNYIQAILNKTIGFGNYEYWWCPAYQKDSIGMTRSAIARRKLTREMNKIKHNYPLFVNQFIANDEKIKKLLIASVTSLLPMTSDAMLSF